MLRLGRGQSMRTRLFSLPAPLDRARARRARRRRRGFWETNPWLIPFALAPLVLIHRSLSVPQLQAEARVDPKTGLFNARHFAAALTEELGRAQRFERPMSLIMADLDLLRDINNTYGHLAGDAVLKGIAEVFRAQLRHYDVPARFGGEEFSILLPGDAAGAGARDRRADPPGRRRARRFDVETSSEPIRATVSIGVAGFPKDAQDPNELIHQADLAVYRAKLQGRNRVLGASSEPLLVPTERVDAARRGARGGPGSRAERGVAPAAPVEAMPEPENRHTRHTTTGPRFLQLSRRLALVVGLVSTLGVSAGILGLPVRQLDGHRRPARDRRARRSGAGARARAGRRRALGQRRRLRLPARRCSAPRVALAIAVTTAPSTGARAGRRSTTSSSTSAR